jgi:hypothetical protein
MKRSLLLLSISATLLTASFASAQTSPPTSDQSTTPAQSTYKDPNDPSKGQELVGDKQQPASTPATVGQDKAVGNNLVPADNDGTMHSSQGEHMKRPDFKTLDTTNKGYLTADDVASHHWLSKNFARCNTTHDGHLTAEQFANCSKSKE